MVDGQGTTSNVLVVGLIYLDAYFLGVLNVLMAKVRSEIALATCLVMVVLVILWDSIFVAVVVVAIVRKVVIVVAKETRIELYCGADNAAIK
jgi:hypothetical protein